MARDIYLKDGGMGATAIATVIGLMAFASDRPAVAHVSMTAREVLGGGQNLQNPARLRGKHSIASRTKAVFA